MDRVLVGVDSSSAAHDALQWSADLARRADLELLAVRVVAPPQTRDEQQRELDEWCASLDLAVPPRTFLVDGTPAEALLAAYSEHAADLLVVGARGAGGFLHLHLGSVAHHLIHHAPGPVAIVPRTGSAPVEHVVIGVDGLPESLDATEIGGELAARLGVGVTAVYAFEPMAEWVPESDARSWHSRAEDEVRTWTATIEQAGVPLDVDVDRDVHPVAAIARALDAHTGSIAVIGTRGKGGFSGLRLGRVPLQLVDHAGAAVIVVPHPTGG
ncbi:MAG: universal stress protein [Acidimicrobiales bacterium]